MRGLSVLLLVALACPARAAEAPAPKQESSEIEEVVVFGDAALAERLGSAGSWDALDSREIRDVGATHVSELVNRVPGTLIQRGSGQESLTAIRSAVLTGAGACGAFLFLQDGISTRPQGFCNVNDLFEVNTEQADSIEVWRGPASAVLGGNALYGAINVLSDLPESQSLTLEGGPYDFYRIEGTAHAEVGGQEFGASVHGESTNGWRDDTGYDQQKATFVHRADVGDWNVFNTLEWSNLNQETGGYVSGFEAYKDNDLRKTNPNPEAYRDAWSLRAASHWRGGRWYVTPYARYSQMKFLQHFLPGEPKERNHQTSGGVLTSYAWDPAANLELTLGAQAEYMHGHLDEIQANPLTDSSAFNNAVRPQGVHYDYDVDSVMVAGYYNLTWTLDEATRVVSSLRLEYLDYHYDNNSLDGNTRDDGTPCGFGGCLYLRPADRGDDYTNLAGRLGLERDVALGTVYAVVGSGFRPPQATELYRLQRGQDVADLDSEELVSFETGVKGDWWNLAAFVQKTNHFIFRDAAGFNVSDGKLQAYGVELFASRTLGRHTLSVSGTYAKHEYAFNRDISGAEVIEDGNVMDTAPRWLGRAWWQVQATERLQAELEVIHQGGYYVNADNTARYTGHTVGNLRARYRLREGLTVFARVINITDRHYADRADWTFFSPDRYRYFPAMPRQFYGGVQIEF